MTFDYQHVLGYDAKVGKYVMYVRSHRARRRLNLRTPRQRQLQRLSEVGGYRGRGCVSGGPDLNWRVGR